MSGSREMVTTSKFMLLNLPNPPFRNIYREYAGGFGTEGTLSSEILLPTYLLYGASALKNLGYEYEALDAQAMNYNLVQTVDAVKRSNTDVLIAWPSLPSLYDDLAVLQAIKKENPEMFVIALGTVCNVMPEEILMENGTGVDLVVRGWHPHYNLIANLAQILARARINEGSFEKIAGAVYLKDGKIVQSPVEPCQEDLDQVSFEVYHQLPLESYMSNCESLDGSIIPCIPITTSTGCPFGCIYCPYPVGFGKKIVNKSTERIIAEIEFLKTNFGIQGFVFRDQLFTHNRERVLKLCEEMIKRKVGINWLIEARPDEVDLELLKRMKEAGCFRIHYGVETGDPNMLKKTGKPGVDIKEVKRAFEITKKSGIFTVAFFILGLPGETKETLEHTSNILIEINPDKVNLNVLTPYPGTKLFEIASLQGWIHSEDWSNYTSYKAVMKAGELNVDQIDRARVRIKNRFRNWKIIHDRIYRGFFIRSLPRKIRDRVI